MNPIPSTAIVPDYRPDSKSIIVGANGSTVFVDVPLTFVAPPLFAGDGRRVRLESGVCNPFAWNQAAARNMRRYSWDDLAGIPGFVSERQYRRFESYWRFLPNEHPVTAETLQDVYAMQGYTRETWIAGFPTLRPPDDPMVYDRLGSVRPLRQDDLIIGDRIGHLVIKALVNGRTVSQCDCDSPARIHQPDWLCYLPLSCGSCPPCSGSLASCLCQGCTGIRWHKRSGIPVPDDIAARLEYKRRHAKAGQVIAVSIRKVA